MDSKTISTDEPGRQVVPANNDLAGCLEALTQVAGMLEELTCMLETSGAHVSADLEARVRRALLRNVKQGQQALVVTELVDACSAALELDGGPPAPAAVIRKALPRLIRELFGAHLSCSIKRDGKYVRGFRGLAPR